MIGVSSEAFGVQEVNGPGRGEELADAGKMHPRVFRPSLRGIGGSLGPVPHADVNERAVLAHVEDVSATLSLSLFQIARPIAPRSTVAPRGTFARRRGIRKLTSQSGSTSSV